MLFQAAKEEFGKIGLIQQERDRSEQSNQELKANLIVLKQEYDELYRTIMEYMTIKEY